MEIKSLLKKVSRNDGLSENEAFELFETSLDEKSEITDEQIAAYLMSTSIRELKADELLGAAKSLRKHFKKVDLGTNEVLDTCGTGGSGLNTFNTSTIVAIVLASMGVKIAKHGNRASSSKSGSADLLEEIGYNLDAEPTKVFNSTGFCFMFAPTHHKATKRVALIRKQLGIRTIFNFIGPLTNPASCGYQVIGVSKESAGEQMAIVLKNLGTKRAMIAYGHDGLDEVTLSDRTTLWHLKDGNITKEIISAEDFGLNPYPLNKILGEDSDRTYQILKEILCGKHSPHSDLVCANAACGLVVLDKAKSFKDGVQLVKDYLSSGEALIYLDKIVKRSNESAS